MWGSNNKYRRERGGREGGREGEREEEEGGMEVGERVRDERERERRLTDTVVRPLERYINTNLFFTWQMEQRRFGLRR